VQRALRAGADLGRVRPQIGDQPHGLFQPGGDFLVAVQVTAQGHIAKLRQPLGAGFRVAAQPEHFGEHQHAGARALGHRVEGQMAVHLNSVGFVGQGLRLHGCPSAQIMRRNWRRLRVLPWPRRRATRPAAMTKP
jgi:hypothetical protein